MLSVLSSLFSPLHNPKHFNPSIKRGFMYSRFYEGLPETGVIPVKKYPGIFEAIRQHPELKKYPIYNVPAGVGTEDLELVHTAAYVDDLLNMDMTPALQMSEIMLNYDILEYFLYGTMGTIQAVEMALASGGTFMNLAGGYHHAFRDHAEGFCFVNDVAIAIERVIKKQPRKVLVIDLDLHQGNGIVHHFQGREDVFVFNLHQADNYPVKQVGHLDIGLMSGTSGEEYLRELERGLAIVKAQFTPELVVYVAGVDPFMEDRLGGFLLTKEDMKKREQLVRQAVDGWAVPCAIVLAGGYANKLSDLIELHVQTAEVMMT